MLKRFTLSLLIAAIILTPCGYAGPFDDYPPPPGGRADVAEKVRTMKIWKMTEELELSQEQAEKFFPLLNKMESKSNEITDQQRDALDRLGDLVWEKEVNANQINELIEKYETLEIELINLRQQFRLDAGKILRPDQVGKMILFNRHFPRIMREMIEELEGRPPGPPPPPPRRPRGW